MRPKGDVDARSQTHTRVFSSDLNYSIGIVTHRTDRCIWALRVPNLTVSQKEVAGRSKFCLANVRWLLFLLPITTNYISPDPFI